MTIRGTLFYSQKMKRGKSYGVSCSSGYVKKWYVNLYKMLFGMLTYEMIQL